MPTGADTIGIVVNGEPRRVEAGSTVASLLAAIGVPAERVAVEVNRRIVRSEEWASTALAEGSRVEVVQFVGGG
jgi:thiamine biosynthesis protein ThiS